MEMNNGRDERYVLFHTLQLYGCPVRNFAASRYTATAFAWQMTPSLEGEAELPKYIRCARVPHGVMTLAQTLHGIKIPIFELIMLAPLH